MKTTISFIAGYFTILLLIALTLTNVEALGMTHVNNFGDVSMSISLLMTSLPFMVVGMATTVAYFWHTEKSLKVA